MADDLRNDYRTLNRGENRYRVPLAPRRP
jgi:hypothetical protein